MALTQVTADMLASTLDLSSKTLTMPDGLKPWTYTPQTATTSGVTVTLTTAIPSSATEVEVLLNGVSTNTANQPPLIQLGDSGGFEGTGYIGITSLISAANCNEDAHTDGFSAVRPTTYAAAEAITGVLRMHRWDTTEHLWFVTGQFTTDAAVYWCGVSGFKATSAEMDRVRLATTGGSATFDAGEARVRYR